MDGQRPWARIRSGADNLVTLLSIGRTDGRNRWNGPKKMFLAALCMFDDSVASVTIVKHRSPGGLAVLDLGFMESTQKLIVS